MFEGFAWLIPLWAVHITAFWGAGFAVTCWYKAVAATNHEEFPGTLWPFSFAVLTNLGFVVGVWVVGRLPALQTEILGISIARMLLCLCIILTVILLLICFLRSKGAASTSMSLIKNSSAFLIVTNVAGVILFVLVSLSEH